MKRSAFTLVELIVVITILAILGTIAYVSFQGFTQDSRDSARISDINLINKTLKLYATRVGPYPDPDNATPIIFSGAVAWNQGEFNNGALAKISTVGKLSNVPVDPLTGNPYAYSKTATSNEYQLGAALEGPIQTGFNLIDSAYANDQIAYSYIRGNYNERFLNVTAGSSDYILAVPSIIASDILDAQLITIATNQKLSYYGTSNLPSTYTGTLFAVNTPDGFNYPANANDIIVYSGSVSDLSDPVQQLALVTNLQNAYSGTVVSSNVSDLMTVDLSNDAAVNNYVATLTNSEVGGLESVGLEQEFVSSGGSGGGGGSTTEVLFYIGGIINPFSQDSQSNIYASVDNGVTWGEVGTPFPTPVQQCRTIYSNDKLLVVGGVGSENIYSTIDGTSWSNEGSLLPGHSEFNIVEYDNKFWILGGNDRFASPITPSNKIYNSTDGITWIDTGLTLPASTSGRESVAVFNNKIWLMSGAGTDGNVYSFDGTTVLDSSDPTVSDLGFNSGSWGHAFVLGSKLIHITGLTGYILSTSDGATWINETDSNGKTTPYGINNNLFRTSTIVHNNDIYLVGGYDLGPGFANTTPLTNVYVSSNGLDNWTLIGNIPAGRGSGCLGKIPLTNAQISALGL